MKTDLKSVYFLGIDIGTYESKGVITDAKGKVIAFHACPHVMEWMSEPTKRSTFWKINSAGTKSSIAAAALLSLLPVPLALGQFYADDWRAGLAFTLVETGELATATKFIEAFYAASAVESNNQRLSSPKVGLSLGERGPGLSPDYQY